MTVRSMYVYNGSTWDEVGYTVSHDIPADGTTGQVLAKVSAGDYDTAWADPDRFTVNATGDLLVGTAADTVGRLALGTDNYALTVNTAGSGVAKIGWEDPTANPLTVTAMALKVNTATVGNLLTANQASVETDTTGWGNVSNASIAASATQAKNGTKSLRLTATATDAYMDVHTTAKIPVTAGQTYTMSCQSRAGSTARLVSPYVFWYDAGNVELSATAANQVNNSTSGWTRHLSTAVAPATATQAVVMFRVFDVAASEIHYLDELGFWEGAGGQWALPGTPITNLGYYTDESVGRRLFQWDANNSRWQMTFGDTGWRDVSAGLESGTTGEWRMRRVNSTVTHHVYNVTNSSGVMYTIPAGFRTVSYGTVIPLTKWDLTAGAVLLNSPATGSCTLSDGLKGYTGAYYMFTHDTSDAWPTTLPGTAVGSIPA